MEPLMALNGTEATDSVPSPHSVISVVQSLSAVEIFTKLRSPRLEWAQGVLRKCEEGGTTENTERH